MKSGLLDINGKEIETGHVVKYKSREQVGEYTRGKHTYSKYDDVEILGVVKFGEINNYPHNHILTFFVETDANLEYETYFWTDSKNKAPSPFKKNLTKPLFTNVSYEIFGEVTTN